MRPPSLFCECLSVQIVMFLCYYDLIQIPFNHLFVHRAPKNNPKGMKLILNEIIWGLKSFWWRNHIRLINKASRKASNYGFCNFQPWFCPILVSIFWFWEASDYQMSIQMVYNKSFLCILLVMITIIILIQ